jgi:hypothetical protein
MAAGIVFGIGSRNYSLGESARPGPGYFPLLLSVIMTIIGAVVIFKALTIESEDGDPIGKIAWKPLIVIVASIVVFGFTITSLGMVISIPILIVIASLAGDEFHWTSVLGSSVVLTGASWVIFVWGLGLTIPVWPAFIG